MRLILQKEYYQYAVHHRVNDFHRQNNLRKEDFKYDLIMISDLFWMHVHVNPCSKQHHFHMKIF